MRQILFGEQWIHPEAPKLVKEIFYAKGKRTILKKGSELLHGAPSGEVTLLLSGICLYRFWDSLDKEHIMSIIPPGRTVGDIDAFCGNIANVSAYMAKGGTGLVLPYHVWHESISANKEILEQQAVNIVVKQESHIEALLACFTLDVEKRLMALFHALIKAYYPPKLDDWNPLPFSLTNVLIAKVVSASRTSVSLILSDWQSRGLFKKDGRIFLIHGNIFCHLYDWWETDA